MGNHYIPRYYLKGFIPDSGNFITVYDRKSKQQYRPNIKNVGQENNLYSDELEATLTKDIEQPAIQVFEKIKKQLPLLDEDRKILSIYIATLHKRVPSGKDRFKDSMPEVSEEVRTELHENIDHLISSNPELETIGNKRKQQITEYTEKYKTKFQDEIWHQVLLPEATPRMTAHLEKMTWLFIYTEKQSAFLTSDNPVFVFRDLGIGNPESELSFPINGGVTLWATNRRDVKQGYFQATDNLIKELNRRTVKNSRRFVYAGTVHKWQKDFVFKPNLRLNRIQ